jgi:DNA transposition AAA+ family ATPase
METIDETEDVDGGDAAEHQALSIPGDAVLRAATRLMEEGAIDQEGKAAILWFHGHARDKGMSLDEAGRCLDRDGATVYRLLHGRYGAGYGNLVAQIQRYRKIAEERAKRKDIGFIETSTWRKISVVCRGARYDSMPAYIYGASQIGKTACLEEYARRNNHGQTRYVRMPGIPTFVKIVNLLSEACYISSKNPLAQLERRLMRAIDDRTLVIFDEFHEVFVSCNDLVARRIVEFIREVYDRTHCGIVICGTKVVRDELEKGRQSMVWDQFRRRGMVELMLPDAPPRSDIVKIAAAFGLPEPDETALTFVREMLQRSGLGMYFRYMQLAHGVAVSRKEALTWAHFIQAYRSVQALSRGSAAP